MRFHKLRDAILNRIGIKKDCRLSACGISYHLWLKPVSIP